MIVSVIVDIPASQVNHIFDYQVDEAMQPLIRLGIRVQVPFGRRQLMAYVVAIHEMSDFEGKLKSVTAVIEYESYLNAELIQLSDYLATYLQTFRIAVLQTMLPSLLKVQYTRQFSVRDSAQFQTFLAAQQVSLPLNPTGLYEMDRVTSQLTAAQIKQLIDEDIAEIVYQVKNQAKPKRVKYVQRQMTNEDLRQAQTQLSKRSQQLAKLADFIIEMADEPLTQKAFLTLSHASPYTLNRAIKQGWLKTFEAEVYRDPDQGKQFNPTQPRSLTVQQQAVFQAVVSAIKAHQPMSFLLEGVTGSGKTEIYLQLMAQAQAQGQTALLLVPEIALTPQMVTQVKQRFQAGVAVIHSGLSITEKYDEWRRIIKGEAKIVVGARSSIFAPLQDIGIIIIDEEHETSYKQAENPRYHARDVALWRAKYHQCPVVLGSATPSLESRARAQVGHYQHLRLTERINQTALPQVQIVDMRQLVNQASLDPLSSDLKRAISDRLAKHEQVVLLLNRRGYANYLMCRECGYVFKCPKCDIALTYHKHDHAMKCHYCDFQSGFPQICPQCGSQHLRAFGSGTQKIEEALLEAFPQARVLRMDVDTTSKKGAHERILAQFAQHEADILLGTQMIAKGLDFEKVTLVGVINADTALNLPDFRASERTFQLLTQVAGRAGRGRYPGQVLIQTYNPDHYVIQFAKSHDYSGFFNYEMRRRQLAAYPPYYLTTLITVISQYEAQAYRTSFEIKQRFVPFTSEHLMLLGPNRANIAKVNEKYYFQILIKYKSAAAIQKPLEELAQYAQSIQKNGITIAIDHEPLFF